MTTRIRNHRPNGSSTPPGVLSFRQSKYYDYSSPAVMRGRAASQQQRRELAANGAWVIGRFVIVDGGAVQLEAIRLEVGWWIDDRRRRFTTDLHSFARWRTKQGARQWLQRHRWPGCRLVNLERLVRAGIPDAAGVLPPRQPGSRGTEPAPAK